MDKSGFDSDLVGMTVQVVWCNGEGWISLGFGWHDCPRHSCNGAGWISLGIGWHNCTGCLVQWTRVDFTRIWLPLLSKKLLAMEQGGFHWGLVGMTVQVVWCNGQQWISLGFGCHYCPRSSWQWSRVDFTRVRLA